MNIEYNQGRVRFTLDNGLRVVMQKSDKSVIDTRLLIKSGYLHDPETKEGIAHIREHIAFNVIRKDKEEDVMEELNGLGGLRNAVTMPEETHYATRILNEDFVEYMGLLYESVFEPGITAEIVRREKLTIGSEECGHEDTVNMMKHHIGKLYFEKRFEGHRIVDYQENKESVANIELRDVIDFQDSNYVPSNAELYVVGDLPDDAEQTIREIFSRTSKKDSRKKYVEPPPDIRGIRTFKTSVPDAMQSYIALGMDGPSGFHGDFLAVSFMSDALRTRLFTRIRQKERLTYGVDVEYICDKDSGEIVVVSHADPDEVERVLQLVLEEMKHLGEVGITEKEFAGIKKMQKLKLGSFYFSAPTMETVFLEDVSGRTYESMMRSMESLTIDDIKGVAKKYLNGNDYILAITEPETKAADPTGC